MTLNKAVMVGATGCRNRGVEALVRSTGAELVRLGMQDVTVVTSDLRYDQHRLGTQFNLVEAADAYFYAPDSRRRLKEAVSMLRRASTPSTRLRERLSSADVVIATGGDIFGSDYGPEFLHRNLIPLRIGLNEGTRTGILSQSIGPFKSRREAEEFKDVAESLSFLSVRERISRTYLVSTLGVSESRVLLGADPAFLLNSSKPERLDEIELALGLDASRPYVALAPSMGISMFSKVDADAHFLAWCDVLDYLLNDYDYDILLIPHVQDSAPPNDDSALVTRLALRFAGPRVRSMLGDFSAADYKGLISRAQFLAGERMHACIAGLSSCVPTLSVGYSVKAEGICRDLYGESDLFSDVLLSIHQFTAGRCLDSLDRLVRYQNEHRSLLAGRLPEVRARAREAIAHAIG